MTVLRPGLPIAQQAALGWVPNMTAVTKFGRNSDVDVNAGEIEDVWEGGGLYTGFPAGVVNTVAETCTVVSSSANDAAAGTGMRTCRLSGLGATGLAQLEDVTLNGTNAVTTTNRWYRVNRVTGLTGGSGQTNAGAITVRHSSTTANIFAVMPAGFGQSQIAAYTIPADQNGLILEVGCSVSNAQVSNQELTASIAARAFGASLFLTRRPTIVSTLLELKMNLALGAIAPPLTDVVLRVQAGTAANLTVMGYIDLLLLKAN